MGTYCLQIFHVYIFVGGRHWICTACHCGGSSVHIMDSKLLFHRITKSTELQIARIYNPLHVSPPRTSLRVEILPVQQQDGCHDCGLFAVAYATEVCLGRRPESATFDQALMRQHLIKCLLNRRFSPFPRATFPSILPQFKTVVKFIKLYCVCNMPDHYDEKMICCDVCNKWFHISCVHNCVPDQDQEMWQCPQCSCSQPSM